MKAVSRTAPKTVFMDALLGAPVIGLRHGRLSQVTGARSSLATTSTLHFGISALNELIFSLAQYVLHQDNRYESCDSGPSY